jgi:hypothetical protein
MDSRIEHAQWRKSSFSGSNGGGCVAVAANLPGLVGVRDSKNPAGAVLSVCPQDWRTFAAAVKAGRLDLA